MTEPKQFTAKDDVIIFDAIEYLAQKADIAAGFSRDGLIKELEERRANPDLFGADEFYKRYAPYAAEKIKRCYQEACRELIEYFNQG